MKCIAVVIITSSAFSSLAATVPDRAVSAQGRIEPEGGVVKVAAPYESSAPQVIREVRVRTGDLVKKGQVVAVLDSQPRLQASVEVAKAELSLAESRHSQALTRQKAGEVEAAEAACTAALADLQHAERELKRSANLDSKAAVAQMDIDRWETEVAVKLALVEQRQHTHAALRDTLAKEVLTAAAAIEAAGAGLRRAEAEAACGEVRAPKDACVLKVLLRAGELASSPLMELGDTQTMNVIAEVYETDIRHVKTGSTARISSKALAGDLKGRVTGIGQRVRKRDAFNVDPAARTDGRVIEVAIRLDDPKPVESLTNLEVDVVIESN